MAETYEEKTALISSGSELVFDFFCEFCKEDGKIIEAEGYCVDCEDYLCKTCYSNHRITKPTRHHELLDKENMPKDTPLTCERENKSISTKCTRHKGELIKFYCKSHAELGCSSCIALNHRRCDDVESIFEKAEGIVDGKEYKEFVAKLESLTQRSRAIIKLSQANISEAKCCYSKAINSLTQFREEINGILDKFEESIRAEAEKLKTEDKNYMKSVSDQCDVSFKTLGDISKAVQELQTSKKVCQLYIAMKEMGKSVSSLQSSLCELERKNHVRMFEFKPSNALVEFLSDQTNLGNISVQQRECSDDNQALKIDPNSIVATHVSDIQANAQYITGSAVLNSTKLVIADCNNHKLKLLDTQSNKMICELKVGSFPWNVAVIDTDVVAVTLEGRKRVLVVRVADQLTVLREISVDGECRGIAFSKGRLIVTFVNPAMLEIMDTHGNGVKRIVNESIGKQLFSCPKYVCVSKDEQTVYVSDETNGTVTCMTFDGTVNSVYCDSELQTPEKLCVDHLGNVYVCGRDSFNIHMITADCIKTKIILSKKDGLSDGLYSVSHCEKTNRMFVGMKSTLKVFQLS